METPYGSYMRTQRHILYLSWRLRCADIRPAWWQFQAVSLTHDTLKGIFHCQKRRPWKLQWLCTKTHEKRTAASCLSAVLHEAVKYRRAVLKSCRWWCDGPGSKPLCQLSLRTYCSVLTYTRLTIAAATARFLQIMERWPLRHQVEISVASQYNSLTP